MACLKTRQPLSKDKNNRKTRQRQPQDKATTRQDKTRQPQAKTITSQDKTRQDKIQGQDKDKDKDKDIE